MNYYYLRPWQIYLDYCGWFHILTEVSKDKVVLVDEDGVVLEMGRLEFVSECLGARYHRIQNT